MGAAAAEVRIIGVGVGDGGSAVAVGGSGVAVDGSDDD